MDKAKMLEVIERVRVVKEAKGLSYQKIADMTEATGEPPVSLSAVKRMFSDEGEHCRWSTVRTVAIAVLGVGFDTPEPNAQDPDQAARYYAQIEGLKTLVEAKRELLAQKDEQVSYLKAEINRYQTEISRYRKVVGVMGAVTLVLLATTILL